jgi:hypothetical protein
VAFAQALIRFICGGRVAMRKKMEFEIVTNRSRQCVSLEARGCALNEGLFMSLLYLEQQRANRFRRPFVLLLIDLKRTIHRRHSLDEITSVLSASTRETDIVGWYEAGSVLGVILTETSGSEPSSLLAKVSSCLRESLTPELFLNVHLAVHQHVPESWDKGIPEAGAVGATA